MKVQCDVCEVNTASIFCCADEAALCDACDRRVHSANKLAGKHRRLSLFHPSTASSSAHKPPICDICQEKTGFLFCKEDRAILCRDCDVKVHTASELTRRHIRFLLTGVRVSSAPAGTPAASEEEVNRSTSFCNVNSTSDAGWASSAIASASDGSSISEYLTKTLPGWQVEDFLLADAAVAVSSHEAYQQGGTLAVQNVGGLQQQGYPACARLEQQLHGNIGVEAGERTSRELRVPQMHTGWPGGSKRPRASPPCSSYW